MVKSFQHMAPISTPCTDSERFDQWAGHQQLPSLPREIPFRLMDPQNKQDPSLFSSLAEVIRHHASHSQNRLRPAVTQLDDKGREINSLNWEKLGARAEKVAMVIREKSGLMKGASISLIYRKSEIIEFIAALLGCFIAGMIAVPINQIEGLSELWYIFQSTKTHLVLTTDNNLKTITKTIKVRNQEFPKEVDWWPTNDFGSLYAHQTKSGKYNSIHYTPIAYIEFTKSLNGELKGVTVSHRTIMRSCYGLVSAMTETVISQPEDNTQSVSLNWNTHSSETILSYLEPRQQLGLHLSVLGSIYNGSHTLFTSPSMMETPTVWIQTMSKYKVTMALANYPSLLNAAQQSLRNSRDSLNKKTIPDLSSLRFLLIDSMIVKPDLDEWIADRLLRPWMVDPIRIITPILSLPEHGGSIVSFRDYLGPSRLEEYEQMYNQLDNTTIIKRKTVWAPGSSRDLWHCVLDRDALRRKKIVVLPKDTKENAIKVGSHGFPFPNTTIAIVDPETTLLCLPDEIGEVWIDSPSLAEGFWEMPVQSEIVYHAVPIVVPSSSESCRPESYPTGFLRTGWMGTMIEGRLVILGSYEDQVRQHRTKEEEDVYLGHHLVDTLLSQLKIQSSIIFDIMLNHQHLPVVAVESELETDHDLKALADKVNNTLFLQHRLIPYIIFITSSGALPRLMKDGHLCLHTLMTKHQFLLGQLPIKFLKINTSQAILQEASALNYDASHPPLTWRWVIAAYEHAIVHGRLPFAMEPQHTGIEIVKSVIDERTGYDLFRFNNIIDILLWRTSLCPDENAFISVQQHGVLKPLTWKGFNHQVVTVARLLIDKWALTPGTKVLLLFQFGIDLISALYACFVVGLVPVVVRPQASTGQTSELVQTMHDLGITCIITNSASDDAYRFRSLIKYRLLKHKCIYVDKAPRYSKLLGPESGLSIRSEWTRDKKRPALILVNQQSACRYVPYSHHTIVSQCRTQKITCQIVFSKPLIVTGMNAFEPLGFLYTAFCGVFTGCHTILLSDIEFQENPLSLLELVSRSKCTTLCTNYYLFNHIMNKVTPAQQRRIGLQHMKNLMLSGSRAKPKSYERILRCLALSGLEKKEAINTVYSHPYNPMIATQSFTLLNMILWIDLEWLRQGIVQMTENRLRGVPIQDSGIVPANTMIAIVNPDTKKLCPTYTIGEIWVSSDNNVQDDLLETTMAHPESQVSYIRTGDVGFLWHVERKSENDGTLDEGQCLFVLGHLEDIISIRGCFYFPDHIEETVESCHPEMIRDSCCVVQNKEKQQIVVLLLQGSRPIPMLSIIPSIVNAVLERYELVLDVVALVNYIPRKQNNEFWRQRALSMYLKKEITVIHNYQIQK
ncbi:Uncharacterized protein C56F8.02 [Choanephora cucurbitarum]|uniref:Uncharacterized protein C56F8.02 n=1 Tax=Choanephora cucurbitarum TaxID=101091 RepID=A0A1C7N8K9_9FUNG|nr:Uncharacterized protein C56F8.02 [Choanephora cucurbitarum]